MVCTMTLLTGMSLTMAPSASANSVADLETELGECSLRGDADLDGDVDSDDLVVGFQAGKWNTGEYATAFEGDANGDFVYDSADLVQIFQDGGYRDSGCGFGVPFGLTKAVVLEIIEALEEGDDATLFANRTHIESFSAYIRAQFSVQSWALIESTVHQAVDDGYDHIDVFEEINSLLEDQDADGYNLMLEEAATAYAVLPAGETSMATSAVPSMARILAPRGLMKKKGSPPQGMPGFGQKQAVALPVVVAAPWIKKNLVSGLGSLLGRMGEYFWGTSQCKGRAEVLSELHCMNLTKPELGHDLRDWAEIKGCCDRKVEIQKKGCEYDREPLKSDYKDCVIRANDLATK